MLIRNVVDGFLESLPSERALDIPFLGLLSQMGYCDVHFTHGPAEFGKDFIAKLRGDEETLQYAFQSKHGDVSQYDWRSEVEPQLREAIYRNLSHPCFDTRAPRRVVLVLSGRLKGNAALSLQDFNVQLEQDGRAKVDLWDRERLVEYFCEHGPDSFYRNDARDLAAYSAFFACYGAALGGTLQASAIESHSRSWLAHLTSSSCLSLEPALECELIVAACNKSGRRYEAIVCVLALVRYVLSASLCPELSAASVKWYASTVRRLSVLCAEYIAFIEDERRDGGLFAATTGAGRFVTYPVECLRALEVSGTLALLGNIDEREIARRSLEWIVHEPGTTNLVSDSHAVSLVVGGLACIACGRTALAQELTTRAAVWVADRYENGGGLAMLGSSPTQLVNTLLGAPFVGVPTSAPSPSFAATALCDLAMLAGGAVLLEDVTNEFLAVEIVFSYFQPADSAGSLIIDGDDVLQFPNVDFATSPGTFLDFAWGEHIRDEPRSFRLSQLLGAECYIPIALLLRDRYFPTLWPSWVDRASQEQF